MPTQFTLEEMKTAYPELVAQIDAEAYKRGVTEGLSQGSKAGADAERARIQAVEAQTLPGHESLITSLKYDGVTTGEQAAVKVLAAEKALASSKLKEFVEEHTTVVAQVEAVSETEKPKDFTTLVAEYQKDKGCKRGEAIRAIATANPELHQAYLDSINKKKED
jgi:hypothetical protein